MDEIKKHNRPKDKAAAQRKGNRDAERDMYGDGFKSKNRIHKVDNSYNRRDNKIDIRKINESELKKIIAESITKILGKIK